MPSFAACNLVDRCEECEEWFGGEEGGREHRECTTRDPRREIMQPPTLGIPTRCIAVLQTSPLFFNAKIALLVISSFFGGPSGGGNLTPIATTHGSSSSKDE
jgi:hypothetical protein